MHQAWVKGLELFFPCRNCRHYKFPLSSGFWLAVGHCAVSNEVTSLCITVSTSGMHQQGANPGFVACSGVLGASLTRILLLHPVTAEPCVCCEWWWVLQ